MSNTRSPLTAEEIAILGECVADPNAEHCKVRSILALDLNAALVAALARAEKAERVFHRYQYLVRGMVDKAKQAGDERDSLKARAEADRAALKKAWKENDALAEQVRIAKEALEEIAQDNCHESERARAALAKLEEIKN